MSFESTVIGLLLAIFLELVIIVLMLASIRDLLR